MSDQESLISLITQTEEYLSGKPFSAKTICDLTGRRPNRVRGALATLCDQRKLCRCGDGRYQKPMRHGIHRARLNDACGLRAVL